MEDNLTSCWYRAYMRSTHWGGMKSAELTNDGGPRFRAYEYKFRYLNFFHLDLKEKKKFSLVSVIS